MAVSVGNLQSASANGAASVTVTKPTGLSVGNGLVAVLYTYNTTGGVTEISTPSGWDKREEVGDSAGADSHRITVFTKIADSSDVSASDFTFNAASSTFNWRATVFSTTGSRTDVLYSAGGTDSEQNTNNPSLNPSVTPSQNTVLYVAAVAGAVNETFSDTNTPVINGTNPTWTKQYDGQFDLYTAPVTTTAAISSFDFTVVGGSATADWVHTFTVIDGSIDASGTIPLIQETGTVNDVSAQSGINVSLPLITDDTLVQEVSATARNTTTWTNESDTTTTWTNEQGI